MQWFEDAVDFLNYGNPYQELRTAIAQSEDIKHLVLNMVKEMDLDIEDFRIEEIRNYMDEAGIQTGFFTVKAGDRETTQFYSATNTTCPVQSKLRYDQQYQRLTEKSPFFDSFEVGSVFKIGGKDYILNESHMLDIPYGEDIFDIQYPSREKSQ